MKKLTILFLFLYIFSLTSFSQVYWTKLKKNIYINYNSIEFNENSKIGWFKIIEPQQQLYRLEKYKAYCTQNVIEVQQIKIFNYNNLLIEEEVNNNNIGCNYKSIVNGKIYYNALCDKKLLNTQK